MLKTVYSALAVTALLAGTASFAADQTPAPATAAAPVAPVAATATTAVATPAKEVVTPAKETVKATTKHVEHAVKAKATKEAAAPESATSSPKK